MPAANSNGQLFSRRRWTPPQAIPRVETRAQWPAPDGATSDLGVSLASVKQSIFPRVRMCFSHDQTHPLAYPFSVIRLLSPPVRRIDGMEAIV